jgi:hypothetical protein
MAIIFSDLLTVLLFSFLAAVQTAIITRLANSLVEYMRKRAEQAKNKIKTKLNGDNQ